MKKMPSVTIPEPVAQQWAAAKSAYESRTPREQRVLQVLALVVTLLLFWALIFQPVWNWRQSAISDYQRQGQILAWIKANEGALRLRAGAGNAPRVSTSGDWPSVVSRTIGGSGLTMKGMTPEGDDAVRIIFENQSFNVVVGWLSTVKQSLGASVANLEISTGSATGLVNVRATLRRGG